MASHIETTLCSLPNEILLRILSQFDTLSLLPWMATGHKFHALILRIITTRLHLASRMDYLNLILESYHPASKNVEPYLFCDHLGSDSLPSEFIGKLGLGSLKSIYSRFRPIRVEDEGRVFRKIENVQFQPTEDEDVLFPQQNDRSDQESSSKPRLVSHNLSLDTDEPFSQLCVATNLVRLGPRRGVFFNFVSVSDGVVRIKRDWLAERTAMACKNEPQDVRTLWLGHKSDVGICFTVQQRTWGRGGAGHVPVLMARDEDPAVGYKLEYEVLLVRTLRLLLAFEEASRQAWGHGERKAVVFGNFTSHGD